MKPFVALYLCFSIFQDKLGITDIITQIDIVEFISSRESGVFKVIYSEWACKNMDSGDK